MDEKQFSIPLTFPSSIVFCLLSISIILIPALFNELFFHINIPLNLSIWLNIPAFLIPTWIIIKKNNIKFTTIFLNYKLNSVSFWCWSLFTTIGLIIVLGEIENYILYYFPISNKIYDLMELLLTSTVGVLAVSIMAPLTEELFFRGALLNGFKLKYSNFSSIILSAFLFGFIHLNPWQFLPAFIGGILFGYLYLISNNIWICIFLHFFNNSLAVFIETIGIPIKGMVYDPRLGIEFQSIFLTISGVIIFILGITVININFNQKH
jgi:uncharacterized protein